MTSQGSPSSSQWVGSSSAVSFGVAEPEREDVRLHVNAAARLVLGTALLVGAAAVVGALGVDWIDAGEVFVGAWIVALAGFALVRIAGPRFAAPVMRAAGRARASADDPVFSLSYRLVLIGLALMLPLTAHLALARMIGERTFESWVLVSIVLVGHVHGVLAFLLARRASALASGDVPLSRGAVYGITVAVSAVPGAFLFFAPVGIVAATGLAFVPVMALADRFIAAERAARLARGAAT